uniref:Uncharacterized protein n=1 Tax=Arundo donax TaxID=35708 RepID=A0A0A9EMV2_ARUDO
MAHALDEKICRHTIQMRASSKEMRNQRNNKKMIPPFDVLDISYVVRFVARLSCKVTCCLKHRIFFRSAAEPKCCLVVSVISCINPVKGKRTIRLTASWQLVMEA